MNNPPNSLKNNFIRLLFILCLSPLLQSQDMSLYTSFLGKYDFTMIGNTMNIAPNGPGVPCTMLTSSSATLDLTPGQVIAAAYLYWGGSGGVNNFDFDVKLNGVDITPERTFLSDISGLPVSGAFTDVTAQVIATGNGVYTFSDFDLNSIISPYCPTGGNFGGWSLLVVYEDLSLSNNLVNIYDGFERVDSSHQFVEFELENLNILNLVGNKIAYLAWEGDANIQVNESLRINGNIVSDPPLNPATNVFNGTNSFTGSNTLYNMDLDLYDINDYTSLGDDTLLISLQSGQDAVVIHNVALVLNSEVPDATIDVATFYSECDDRDVVVNYTVHNTIATAPLPANVPIAFYIDDELLAMSATENEIPIGGSEAGTITLTIPEEVPIEFILTIAVDDDGEGNSTVIEFDETNNTYETLIRLGITPTAHPGIDLLECSPGNNGTAVFDLTVSGDQILGNQEDVLILYYTNENDAIAGNNNNITNPEAYTNITSPQNIYVRLEDPVGCFVVTSFTITAAEGGEMAYAIPAIQECSPGGQTTGIVIDLTQNEEAVLNGNDPELFEITYHLTQQDAVAGTNPIPNPENYSNIASPQTIWVRMIETSQDCSSYGSFDLIISPTPETHNIVHDECSFDETATINLPSLNPLITDNPAGLTFTYYQSMNDAENQINPLPSNFTPPTAPYTVYCRVEATEDCFDIAEVILNIVNNQIELNEVLSICDSPMGIGDGFAEFDLTEMNDQINISLGLNQSQITYHTTANDARNGLNAISDPSNYTNQTNPQIIYARVEGLNGNCGGIVSFKIEVLPVPDLELDESLFFCGDDPFKTYEFSGPYSTYTWFDSQGNVISEQGSVEFTEEGIYTLEVTSAANECPAQRQIEVIIDNPVIVAVDVDGNQVSVTVAGGSAPYKFSYDNGLSWHDDSIFYNLPGGIYDLIAKSVNGCISPAKTFAVLEVPNVITPNSDGRNDVWRVRGLENYSGMHIKIFDRNGKIFVDRSLNSDFIWDGKYLGNPVPSGSYWYIITFDEGEKSITGHITVKNHN